MGGEFITCDHPICLMWSDPKMRGNFYGPGLGLPSTEILFPISTKLALIGAFEIKDAVLDISDMAVAGFNGAMVAYAQRHVYARDMQFSYSMQPNEPARKASKLITDRAFLRPEVGRSSKR